MRQKDYFQSSFKFRGMIHKLAATFILLCTLGALPPDHSRRPDLSRISRALNIYNQQYAPEKVFLMSDREQYNPGEMVWLKGYVTTACKPSVISKVLYIELIDIYGIILNRVMLPVEDGVTDGGFALPEDFPAGRYRVRGYTSWMMNFDPGFYFEK